MMEKPDIGHFLNSKSNPHPLQLANGRVMYCIGYVIEVVRVHPDGYSCTCI